jgi:uncharacterized phage protein gp47/JayE
MSYTRPTQEQIYNDTKADLFSRFPNLDPTLANSMALAVVSVETAAISGNYDYLDWILMQIFVDTATGENLDRWGAIFGVFRQAAAKSTGSVEATGTVGVGFVAIGEEMQTVGGTVFVLTQALDFTASSPQSATVEAKEFGFDGNIAAAVELDFVQSWAGVADFATVEAGGLTGGRTREDDDSFRAVVLNTLAEPAKGGALYDYDRWAREAAAVTRTFVRNWENGPLYGDSLERGQILVYFAMDDTYSDGIPLAGDATTVQAYIDIVKPAGAEVTVTAPTASVVDWTATILPNNATTQAATDEAMENMIIEQGIVGGTIPLNKFQEAMSAVPGLTSWTLNLPTAGVAAGVGELHTTGTGTYL